MKHILSIIILSILLISCGSKEDTKNIEDVIATNDLEAIKTKRSEIKIEQAKVQEQLKTLDAAIKKLDTTDNATLVTVQAVKDTLFQHFIELQGNVETTQNVIIYPEFQGTLSRVFVNEGDRVSKGQVLARIDDGGLSSQLGQLEAQATLAKTTYERQKRLWDQNIGSEIQFLQTKTSYESAENAVNQMKSQLGKTNVRAPFSGVIDDVITEQGTVVAPGQELFRIINLKDMHIKADVPERFIKNVTKGKNVHVEFPILGETIATTVKQTGNYINPNNRTFSVEIAIPNKDGTIKPNLTAKLKINDYTSEQAILIPLSVISEDGVGEQYVYTASAKTDTTQNEVSAKKQYITTGKSQGDAIEVLEGLKAGDQIIIEGARSVKEGQAVKILNL